MCLQTSDQVKDYLLCRDCEELFNKSGERWVIRHCYREKDGCFQLRDCLRNLKPFIWIDGEGGFDTANVPGIDHDQIVYYAMSIFWRAAIRAWHVGRETISPIELGPYHENFRRFMRGEEVLSPYIYLSIWLSNRDTPVVGSNVPTSWHVESGGIMHRMNIPGIAFLLTIGKRVSDPTRQTCFLHEPGRPVFMSTRVDDQLFSNLLATAKGSLFGGQLLR